MASEEVAGSIVGFLRLDADEFHREITKAIAEIKVLSSTDAKVRVEATGVERTTRSVVAASKSFDGLVASQRRVNDATDKVRIAQAKLDEVQGKSNATASQHLSAMQALQKARRAEQDAIFDTYRGNINLGESNDIVGKSARRAAGDVDRMGKSFKGLRDPRLIVGAIGAGMALLGPVTGAATAALGGFVGVAGTAVLAWKGFQKEIESGTSLGNTLKGSLSGVGAEFQALGTTASHAMADGVLASLSAVHDFLPTLNPEVATLGHNLGNALRISTKGLIVGLQNAMPLLQDGGRYAEMFAQKLADFAYSQDFKDFVDYARRELPNVGTALLSFTSGIKDLAVALAPVGDDLISLIHVSGQFASAISPVISFLDKVRRASGSPYQFAATEALKKVPPAADPATIALQNANTALESMTNVQSPLASALGTTDAALSAAEQAHRANASAAAEATAKMQVEGDAAGLLKQKLDQLNGKALNVASTQNSFDSALANSNKHIAANGKTIDRATTSLSGMSAAAVANRSELIQQVKAAEDVATAMRDNGASTDDTRKKMVAMRDQIVKNAEAHGLDGKAVQAFIDKLYKIPKTIPPTKLEVETKQAMAGIAAFQKAIDSLHGKSVTANVRYAYTGQLPGVGKSTGGFSTHGGSTFKDGGQIPGYAGGTIVGPGTGTSDSILGMVAQTNRLLRVSAGEFISTNASRQRNAAALEAGNRGATLAVADGSGRVVELGPTSIAAIAAAVSRVKVKTSVSSRDIGAALVVGT